MKVSLNTIKQYIDFELPSVDELVKRINEQLGGVEEVIDLAAKYKDAMIVKIVSAEKHPNADRLRVCRIDDGGKTADVPRDENGYVQVVCGAPNAEAGKTVVWLPPKSIVPASFDEKELSVLEARDLRGVLSQGMLAAPDELAIGSVHDGILEVNMDEWKPSNVGIKPGVNFAEVYGLNDTVIDIENKMFTHRPDLFGQLGVAREIAGILGHEFISPSWYAGVPKFETGGGLELDVFNEAGEKVPRFIAVAIKNIEIKPSPLWLQCALVAMGSKPINNIVDVTNYVMLLTAQPTHAYDYDKLRGHKLGARMAQVGEKVTLLNHKEYELDETDIVIADSDGPVGLAGIMGGGESEVDENTKNIVLEVATFNMYAVRKSSMHHGIFTDALTRFNKGQSPLQNDHIMNLLMMSIKDVSSAEQASDVFDKKSDERNANLPVAVTQRFINDRLGLQIGADEMKQLLENVEMRVEDEFNIISPFWRTDIELPEDVVEEVGRLYGFDKLPRELPMRSIKPAANNLRLITKQKIREGLSRAGANEVLTYSFVHNNVMKKAGQDSMQAFQLGNALSPDLQYYRLSLTPSLLDKVHANVKSGYDEFALFEIGKAHHKAFHDADGLPEEFDRVALTYTSKKPRESQGSAYFTARRFAMNLLADFNLARNVQFIRIGDFDVANHDAFKQLLATYDPNRAAVMTIDDKLAGVVGEYSHTVIKNFKLPDFSAGFELFVSAFLSPNEHAYAPLSKFPSITQDISLQVSIDTPYRTVFDTAWSSLAEIQPVDTLPILSPLMIYQAAGSEMKTITLRLTLASYKQTMKEADMTMLLSHLGQMVHDKHGAKII